MKNDEYNEIIGSRLKELRESLNLTQKEFAENFCVSCDTQKKYESGDRRTPVDYLIDICNQFNVTLDWLCGRSEYKNDDSEIVAYILALDKVMKVEYNHYSDNLSTLLIDNTFHEYIQSMQDLKDLYKCKGLENNFSKLSNDIKQKYQKTFEKLFDNKEHPLEEKDFIKIQYIDVVDIL